MRDKVGQWVMKTTSANERGSAQGKSYQWEWDRERERNSEAVRVVMATPTSQYNANQWERGNDMTTSSNEKVGQWVMKTISANERGSAQGVKLPMRERETVGSESAHGHADRLVQRHNNNRCSQNLTGEWYCSREGTSVHKGTPSRPKQ